MKYSLDLKDILGEVNKSVSYEDHPSVIIQFAIAERLEALVSLLERVVE